MNQKLIITVLVTLLIGLGGGYYFGAQATEAEVFEEDEHTMHSDPIVANDGAMMHAMDEMMLELRGKEGEEYEEAFLKGMIVHHLGAIEMAEDLLEQTDRPELVQMANAIISVQTDEIETMKEWLRDWFNYNEYEE
jgi:uncharacterized protein (DUF305 family)